MRSAPHLVSLRRAGTVILACVMLMTAAPVFAQEVPGGEVLEPLYIAIMVIVGVVYLYFALALQVIARKTGAENSWWAWIPILQILLSLKVARKPTWWIIPCLVPYLNIVMFILVWMGIAEARKKPSWWGILLIVPVANLVVPGYLAWSD